MQEFIMNPFTGQPVPPQPGAAPIWPPPAGTVINQLPFKYIPARVAGAMSDFREGAISFDASGFTIDGKILPNQGLRVILVFFLGIIGRLLIRHAMLKPSRMTIPWSQVTQIILQPNKSSAGIAWSVPTRSAKPKIVSLCMRFDSASYRQFAAEIQQHAPQATGPGKFRSATPIVVLILCVVIILAVFLTAIALGGSH
jgi:hypothetical protein